MDYQERHYGDILEMVYFNAEGNPVGYKRITSLALANLTDEEARAYVNTEREALKQALKEEGLWDEE